ncbi:hypothetical protein [Celerinatantimonas yamalensis]|uniref:Uncharacterized protein n=1 Tax=Celerinatantimonas yamalensis TaxID=559956 RepID=A0ABW9G7Y3_9GAMM
MRQEQVFIGQDLEQSLFIQQLDQCLRTDDEMIISVSIWQTWPDPFADADISHLINCTLILRGSPLSKFAQDKGHVNASDGILTFAQSLD